MGRGSLANLPTPAPKNSASASTPARREVYTVATNNLVSRGTHDAIISRGSALQYYGMSPMSDRAEQVHRDYSPGFQ